MRGAYLDTGNSPIGVVESVAPDEIRVSLDLDAPQGTALNAGVPVAFPVINQYLLVPTELGAVVGVVIWVGIERSPYPKRPGLKDFGLVDLPFPIRKLTLSPVGTLRISGQAEQSWVLTRGIGRFPSVGDPVLLPTSAEIRSIVEGAGADRRVWIGASPLAVQTRVTVDPDKLFGRHLAVLGNTGSGKSCSIAGLIRWSLEAARAEMAVGTPRPNARFVVLDPNGEYADAFRDVADGVRIFRVPPTANDETPIRLPAWMWNAQEWSAFAAASPGAQRPLLVRALAALRAGRTDDDLVAGAGVRLMREYLAGVQGARNEGLTAYAKFPGSKNFGQSLVNLAEDAKRYAGQAEADSADALTTLSTEVGQVIARRKWQTATSSGFNDFSETDLVAVGDALEKAIDALKVDEELPVGSEDAPIEFDPTKMPDMVEGLARLTASGQMGQFVAGLALRLRGILSDGRLRDILNPTEPVTLEEWLKDYIGADAASNGQVAILDLSLVSSEVVHILVAAFGRLVLEANSRYRKVNHAPLPVVLVLEEAHHFIRRRSPDEGWESPAEAVCREVFERVAREGRKFGLGLVLSSQRPSELSPTVLAQCNTFLLHRIVNDRDQTLVKRLVPDALTGLLSELPSLPSRQAVLLGWATPIPVLVEMRELLESQQPRSSDPRYWDVWTGQQERKIDWAAVAKAWIEDPTRQAPAGEQEPEA